jgi:hypothetical protein
MGLVRRFSQYHRRVLPTNDYEHIPGLADSTGFANVVRLGSIPDRECPHSEGRQAAHLKLGGGLCVH